MKKVILGLAITATLVSCGTGDAKVEAPVTDSTAVVVDSSACCATVDTTKVADSTTVK
jgi:hypothetical protein